MSNLRIAVQKAGRLNEDSMNLLKDIGISIDNGKDQLKASARNFPVEVFYLRNGDIPQYLRDGVVDAAIIGENVLIEKGDDLEFVEIAPNIGLADGICDIVSSGSTLFKNGLKEIEVLLESEAVLAVSSKISDERRAILQKIQFRIQSVLRGRNAKYVLLNAPNDKLESILALLPGMRSPTVLPLAEKGWSSVHTVITKNEFWEIIEDLKAKGAEGILVCPIEKMVL